MVTRTNKDAQASMDMILVANNTALTTAGGLLSSGTAIK